MTDQTTFELDVSRINREQPTINQLAAAADIWSDYLRSPDAREWIQLEAAKLLNATKLFREPLAVQHFVNLIANDTVARAVEGAMRVDDVSRSQFLRFVENTVRSAVIGTAYRLLADIEIRAALAALQPAPVAPEVTA